MIPLSAPDVGAAEVTAVLDVLATPSLSLGPRIPAFEEALARVAGVGHAVAVNSGTSALHLAVRALGLREGDEVVTTPFTFVATANCLLYERARPVFVDVDPATRNIDPARIEDAITPRTRAILPVHVFGRPCDMTPILEIAARRGISVLEDACEAIGARYRERPAGSFGRAATFSFYPNKQLTTGEGGAVVTDDPAIAEACRRMRNHGRVAGGPLVHAELGFNYRMSDLHAALGLAQLRRLDEILAARARVAGWYTEGLRDVPGLRVPEGGDGLTVSWFVYVVELADPRAAARRDALMAALRERGIATGVYFPAVHLQPFHRAALGYDPGDFPVAEGLAARSLALPFFTRLSHEGVNEVCATLRAVLRGSRTGRSRPAAAPARAGNGPEPAAVPALGDAPRDLLDRPEVTIDLSQAAERLAGQVVLVTGAAGSIGAEICRQIAATEPAALVAVDRSESALHGLEDNLAEHWPKLRVESLLLDVLHARLVRDAFRRLRPAVVFHAAAYKHVPMLERHPAEGVRNNVGGTLNIARAAKAAGVERFVFISTDKAMRPASVLGASKRAAEILLQCLAAEPDAPLDFVTVRFGNVIDSGANVVERFREQIARGGPVTVCHPEMRRYFMTAAEAARLVLHASVAGAAGEVLLLDVGRPHGIMDLARRMIELAATRTGRPVEIELGQPRSGDKLHEDYDLDGLEPLPSTSPHIRRAALPAIDAAWTRSAVRRLLRLADRGDDAGVVALLARLVPDYRPAPPAP